MSFVFSERDKSGEGGGNAAAVHEEGSDDSKPPGQNPWLSSNDKSLSQHS